MTNNGNLPAAPVECAWPEDGTPYGKQTGNHLGWATGLSKREHMATVFAAAMVSTIVGEGTYLRMKMHASDAGLRTVSEWIARDACKQADALLAALDATPLTEARQAREVNLRG